MDKHTPDFVRDFLTKGLDAIPMALIYESDCIGRLLDGDLGKNSEITVMYPNPDVISDNTLVSWTPRGNKVAALFQTAATAAPG